MDKTSPTAHWHHCPSSQSHPEGTQGTEIVHGHGHGTTVPASELNPLHLFPASPRPSTRCHFPEAPLGTGELCVAQVHTVGLRGWALFKCCLLCVLTSVNHLLSISFQAGEFFILLQIPPSFIGNPCQWKQLNYVSETQDLYRKCHKNEKGHFRLGQREGVHHGREGLIVSVW